MAWRVNQDTFAELVERALAELPPAFAEMIEEVPVEIRERATSRQRQKLGLGPGQRLLGLYQGRPRTERGVEDSGRLPDVIYLFQQDIEAVSDSEQELIDQVRTTLLHEIGHHFGLSENDLDQLGYG